MSEAAGHSREYERVQPPDVVSTLLGSGQALQAHGANAARS